MTRRGLLLAVCLVLAAVGGASAAEPAGGAANFRPPGYVPDYFSNESGPFRGGAGTPATAPVTAPVAATPAPAVAPAPARRVAAHSQRRGHWVRLAKARGHHRAMRAKSAAAHRRAIRRPQASRSRTAHAMAAHHRVRSSHHQAAAAAKRGVVVAKGKRVARAGS